MQDPTAPDTLRLLGEIFEPVDDIFRKRLKHAEATSEAARFFYKEYFHPLFSLFKHHKDGLIKSDAYPGLDQRTTLISSA